MKIPWSMPHITDEELKEVASAFKDNWLTMGPKVRAFEEKFAEYVGLRHAIAVNSGTAALDVALKALEIGSGDEVIVPALTYIATANVVLYNQATPVLADIESQTLNISPQAVEKAVTRRTKAVMVIDYGGYPPDYQAIEEICWAHRIHLVQDGAHAIGATYKGHRLPSYGAIAATSFHAAKVMTTVEGGMLFTSNDELASRCRILRNQGEDPHEKYLHTLLGHNYRMSDLNAAIGLVQFRRLGSIIERRSQLAQRYNEALQPYSKVVTLPQYSPQNRHAWFLYSILVPQRDLVQKHLTEKGIDTRVCWPYPIHHQPVYRRYFEGQQFPVAEQVASQVLNLPIYYSLSNLEQDYVIEQLRAALEGMKTSPQ